MRGFTKEEAKQHKESLKELFITQDEYEAKLEQQRDELLFTLKKIKQMNIDLTDREEINEIIRNVVNKIEGDE